MVLKFHMQHDQTLELQNDKITLGRGSKMAASAKNSKTNKINFFSRILSHLSGLFSETTALMVLKFHMQHDQTLELQNDKITLGRGSKMAANAKNSKTNKINFFSRMARYIFG